MRKALIVGIDYYEHINSLSGCVNDSFQVNTVIANNSDGSANFGTKHLTATGPSSAIDRRTLKEYTIELFKDDSDIALFYFAGHGHVEQTGGYLVTSDAHDGDDGFKLDELMQLASNSPARSKIIILDSCYSGAAGSPENLGDSALLKEGVTILSASGKNQYALEESGSGVFTTLLVDALQGGAANLTGDVTPGSVYAHIDQSLGSWQQRPVFKTNVKGFVTLRSVERPIPLLELKKIVQLFSDPSEHFNLDPSFEPDGPHEKSEENMANFKILQKYNRINLVVPVGTEHMYFAAMESRACRLTVLGRHYWKLVKDNMI